MKEQKSETENLDVELKGLKKSSCAFCNVQSFWRNNKFLHTHTRMNCAKVRQNVQSETDIELYRMRTDQAVAGAFFKDTTNRERLRVR